MKITRSFTPGHKIAEPIQDHAGQEKSTRDVGVRKGGKSNGGFVT